MSTAPLQTKANGNDDAPQTPVVARPDIPTLQDKVDERAPFEVDGPAAPAPVSAPAPAPIAPAATAAEPPPANAPVTVAAEFGMGADEAPAASAAEPQPMTARTDEPPADDTVDEDEENDATPPRRSARLRALLQRALLHKKPLIIAGSAVLSISIGTVAWSLLPHAPGQDHDAAPHEAAAPHKATAENHTAPKQTDHTPAPDSPATHANAAHDAPTGPAARAAQGGHHPAQTAADPMQKTPEPADLAEEKKLLTEERARRIAAESGVENLRVAAGTQAAVMRSGTANVGGGKKPGERRLEDCSVQRANFAETLRACIEEFNHAPGRGPARATRP